MSYGTDSFWDIYLSGLHSICGTVVLVVAFVIFLAGLQDHRERKLFWVVTILAVTLLGLLVGEWGSEVVRLNYFGDTGGFGGLADPVTLDQWLFRSANSRMMFMAQAGLAVTFALGLLWWPIRPKED